VAAIFGTIITASTSPEVSRPWPTPTFPRKMLNGGKFGRRANTGYTWWARKGPNVSGPQMPKMTLGMTLPVRVELRATATSRTGYRKAKCWSFCDIVQVTSL